MISALEIFRIGLGPSSSHTVGPMRIAGRFMEGLARRGQLARVGGLAVSLRGSLAFTGRGHRTHEAVVLGLAGLKPETAQPDEAEAVLVRVAAQLRLEPAPGVRIPFDPASDIVADYDTPADLHPNGMRLVARGSDGTVVADEVWYSTGGGFVASHRQLSRPLGDDLVSARPVGPHAFGSAAQLLALCAARGASIAEVLLAGEDERRGRGETLAALDAIARAMLDCIGRGLTAREAVLPGGLNVRRRAPGIHARLKAGVGGNERESVFDWLNVYAMAVNEENAAGGRVVTAPTNGAAGIIPAVLRYYLADTGRPASDIHAFLLTAAAIGILYKQRASISGAEMGCQGEVGVACSMAAGGLAAIWGGTPEQVASAAEIGMEHHLGLTCDPVGGLVQIPCIERNAVASVKAANAARLALHTHETPRVSLDQVIETMRQTGLDMSSKYKETSQGGLAVNVVEC
jgi:L-serine dehydratase